MQHASGKDYNPSAWAKERQERIKRALQARQQRQSGSPDKNHTFKPQLVGGSTSGITSKLPTGARVGDASATRGAYDLTVLEAMDDAFPPKRTSTNIYRDNRHDTGASNDSRGRGVRNKGPMDMEGTSDSLDRLAISTTDRRRLSRDSSTGSRNSALASPRPAPLKSAPYHDSNRYTSDDQRYGPSDADAEEEEEEGGVAREGGRRRGRARDDPGGRWTGPTRDTKNGAWNGPHDDDDGDRNGNTPAAAGETATGVAVPTTPDALSEEVEQRPHVRGSMSEEQHNQHQRSTDNDDDENDRQRWAGGRGGEANDGNVGVPGVNERERRAARGGQSGHVGGESDDVPLSEARRRNAEAPQAASTEDADFFASLRGGGHDAGEGTPAGSSRRGGGTNGTAAISGGLQAGRVRHARRPEWNSDTAAVASLGGEGVQASVLTDNSPTATQARVEMPTRRRSSNDVIAESPYAAGGGALGGGSRSNGITKTASYNNQSGSNNAAWKHKHTKTLPWGEDVAVEATGGVAVAARGDYDSDGTSNGGGDGDDVRKGGAFDGRKCATNQSAREMAAGGGLGGREREGYRRLMVPSPSTGKLTTAAAATAMYRGQGGGDSRDRGGGTAAVPAEKEQLRRNLSLLKKKMHGQGGSRRSQSAGPRAGDLFGDPHYISQGGPGGAEPRHGGGRQHLHMTTGTAPANPGAFLRDRDTTEGGREQLGRRGGGDGARRRPPPEGAGSPYAIDPTSREAAAEAATRTDTRSRQDQHHTYQPQHLQHQKHPQQMRADGTGRKGRTNNGSFSRAPNSGNSSTSSFHDAAAAPAGRRGYGQRSRGDTGAGTHDSGSDRPAASAAARGSRGRTGVSNSTAGEGVTDRAARRGAAADATTLRFGGGGGGGVGSGRGQRETGQGQKSHLSPDRRRAWEGEHDDDDGGGEGGSRGEGSRRKGGVGSRSVGGRGARGGGTGQGGGGRGGYADDLPPDAFPDRQVELEECKMCSRRFTKEALEKHSRACHKVFQAKRKVFNAAEMRIKGTELEKFAKTKGRLGGGGSRNGGRGAGKHGGKAAPPRGFDDTPVGGGGGGGGGGAKSSKWRQQSKQFRDALRQARVVTDIQKGGKSLANLPPPKPSTPDPSFIPCPHCGRRFSELAGERHIQHCKNTKAKPSVLKKGSGSLLGHAARKTSSGVAGGSKGRRW